METETRSTKFCIDCGEQINANAEICPKCGVGQSSATKTSNPGTAAVLSALCTGLGQIYNGEVGKGVLLMTLQVINMALMFVVVGFITFPLLWICAIYDAYNVAKER